MNDYGQMIGRYPAIVKSYDKNKRTCRVEIPALTNGGDVFPEAEIDYPIGDKSISGAHSTEIEINPGDTVWVEFIGADARYPIIISYRNPRVGNSVDYRRFHHANIEMTADGTLKLNAATLEINAATVTINGTNTTINGSSLKHNSKNIGDTHTHGGVTPGSSSTDVPS
ncbi:hypothetical protein Nit79A3_1460 [Nitrosomonas sp. Is79A3]|uniref:hypothetical protein n=1 Tax=Nitrosomonas sp. (strain Is79A3) TaxID=261292 RepID=UPI000215D0D2